MAQTALGVGRRTFAFIVRPTDDEILPILGPMLLKIENAWEDHGKARLPKNIDADIEVLLAKMNG